MKVLIESQVTLTDSQKEHIEKTMQSLEELEHRITQSEIYFKIGDGSNPKEVSCKIRVHIPGNDVVISDSDDDRMKAFNDAFQRTKRQLIKEKKARRPY